MASKTNKTNTAETQTEETSTALVPTTPASQALAAPSPSFMAPAEGMENVRASDVQLPRARIVQPGFEKDGEKAGTFRDTLGVERVELHVAMLAYRHGQVLWAPVDSGSRDPLCKSTDALKPSPEIERPCAEVCNAVGKGARLIPKCPEACWTSVDGKRKPPKCHFTYSVAFWDLDTDTPLLQRFARTGIQAIRQFISRIFLARSPIYGLEAWMRLRRETDPKPHWVPFIGDAKKIAADDPRLPGLRLAWQSAGSFDLDPSDVGEEEREVMEDENGGGGAGSGEPSWVTE